MRKLEWSDKQLEDLLRQMPKIKDHRHPHEIFQSLSVKKEKHNRRTRTWIMPGFAAAAAAILILILSPGLFQFGGSSDKTEMEDMSSAGSMKTANSGDRATALKTEPKKDSNYEAASKDAAGSDVTHGKMDTGKKVSVLNALSEVTALYDDKAAEGRVLTYWIPDKQAMSLVPVTTVVPPDTSKNWIDLINENMSALDEDEWGLTDYYPLKAKLSFNEKENTLNVDVPANHPYAEGSENETSFVNVLLRLAESNSNVKKIKYTTDGQPNSGIMLGNYGDKQEDEIVPGKNRAFLKHEPEGKGTIFLVPTADSYKTIREAILAMEKDLPTSNLKASLPAKLISEKVSIKGKTLLVKFAPGATMSDEPSVIQSYEALLLTAKDFGLEKVKILNPPIDKLGPFDLTVENKVPVGPNYRPLHK
ncbi:hypothetical protein [Neobacillus terrae]|uniref:hypothetical protein n=1 Tax=Neobacillus terrae TaxID=3034837 RepID=UPI001408AADB|nr:hypothetical protein [Neobacillus terrae]NHM29082.1 hypothetical protein [Neobacillus terrae]